MSQQSCVRGVVVPYFDYSLRWALSLRKLPDGRERREEKEKEMED
jgi:hypothetical protein